MKLYSPPALALYHSGARNASHTRVVPNGPPCEHQSGLFWFSMVYPIYHVYLSPCSTHVTTDIAPWELPSFKIASRVNTNVAYFNSIVLPAQKWFWKNT